MNQATQVSLLLLLAETNSTEEPLTVPLEQEEPQFPNPPEGYQPRLGYIRENSTGPRSEIEEKLFSRIQADLGPWRNGISQEMVEHTYCTVSFFRKLRSNRSRPLCSAQLRPVKHSMLCRQ